MSVAALYTIPFGAAIFMLLVSYFVRVTCGDAANEDFVPKAETLFNLLYDAFDFSILVIKIRLGIRPDMNAYWERRGYHDTGNFLF